MSSENDYYKGCAEEVTEGTVVCLSNLRQFLQQPSKTSEDDEDIDYYIDRSKRIVLTLEEQQLSKEDQEHLEYIREWCKASAVLWKVVARIGWEINEG